MKLTTENKQYIDGLSYEQLLHRWRFSSFGDPWFADETGEYWYSRMRCLKSQPGGPEEHIRVSKTIGWSK